MTRVSINLNPSNLGANFSVDDDLFVEFSWSFFDETSSWEAWKFELQAKFVVEESDIAVAEAAATEAAKSPHFFIIARRWKNLFPGNQNFGEHKYAFS